LIAAHHVQSAQREQELTRLMRGGSTNDRVPVPGA
jgi:hypothetical protein